MLCSILTYSFCEYLFGWFLLARPSLQNMDSIDIAYVESGPVQWGGGEPMAAEEDLDEESGDERESENEGGSAHAAVELAPYGEDGVQEEKGGGQERHRAEGSNNGGEGEKGREQEQEPEEKEQHRRLGVNFATELFFLTHRALQVIFASITKRRDEMNKILGDFVLARTGLSLHDKDEGQAVAEAPFADGGVARLQLRVFKEASSAINLGWALEGFGSDAVTGHACQLATFTASWLGLYIDSGQTGGIGEDGFGMTSPVLSSFSTTFLKIAPSLIETMCSSWVRAALSGRDDQFLSRKAAEDAAQFCGQIMERVSLWLLPPVSRGFWVRYFYRCRLF